MDFFKGKLPPGVEKYLEGIEFPIARDDLIGRLKQNGVPTMAVNQLEKRLPEGRYNSPQDVLKSLKNQ